MHAQSSLLRLSLLLTYLAAALTVALASPPAVAASPAAASLPAEGVVGKLERTFAFHDAMPTGVAVTEAGRIFVNFPRWGHDVTFTVGTANQHPPDAGLQRRQGSAEQAVFAVPHEDRREARADASR